MLIAERFGFKPLDFFELEAGERKAVEEAPKVQF